MTGAVVSSRVVHRDFRPPAPRALLPYEQDTLRRLLNAFDAVAPEIRDAAIRAILSPRIAP